MRGAFALLGVLWLLLPAVARGGDVKALDTENGFRNVRFGTTLDALDGLQLLTESGAAGTQLYIRPDESLELGDARLDGVTYAFFRERLYFVTIFTSGQRNTQAVLARFRQSYGPGAAVAGNAVEFVWQGSRVLLHFREDAATGVGMAVLTSLPMDAQVKAAGAPAPADAAP
ncbi:MAG: hypothetical protein JRH16_02230 [Deltaproteobacteria bacterium]|nr:hypothetical protein [Deltaproteobacteria bacterium]MBW2360550.1 hypothetical protein [Deltaproteobacteria bacterium]